MSLIVLIEIVVVPNKSGSGCNVWELFGCDSHGIYFLHTVLEMEPPGICACWSSILQMRHIHSLCFELVCLNYVAFAGLESPRNLPPFARTLERIEIRVKI